MEDIAKKKRKLMGLKNKIEILFNKKAPGRLQRFNENEIAGAFDRAFHRVLAPGRGRSGMQLV